MPRITAIGEVATAMMAVEKGTYDAHVSFQDLRESSKTGAPMMAYKFTIDGGPFNGRVMPSTHEKVNHNVMVGGNKEDGTPHDLGRWYQFLNAIGASYTCGGCGTTSSKKFVKEKGGYFTSCCGKPANIVGVDTDTDTHLGLRCKIMVDQRHTEGFDEPSNEIKSVRPVA